MRNRHLGPEAEHAKPSSQCSAQNIFGLNEIHTPNINRILDTTNFKLTITLADKQ